MRVLLIPGDYEEVAFIPFKGTLHELTGLFSCRTIEIVRTPIPNLVMMVDEDARLSHRPPNHKAMMFYPGPIFGPAVLSYYKLVPGDEDSPDVEFVGIPEGFDWKMVAESSYQRIVASLGEHPIVVVEEPS